MAIPSRRDEQIANFYREHAARLHRGICGKTVGLDDATVAGRVRHRLGAVARAPGHRP